MKRFYVNLVFIFFAVAPAVAQEQSLNDILDKYYKAMGIDRLKKVNSMVMTGLMTQNDVMPVKVYRLRPDKYLMEFDIADLTAYQGYDGTTAWMTTPWTGNPKPQVMPPDRVGAMKITAEFEGILFDWKAKGHLVELAGKDTVDHVIMNKLKITKNDGGVEYLFIDPGDNLIKKRLYNRTVRGREIVMENYFSDYRPVEGIMFGFKQDTRIDGQPYNSLQYETIELNKEIDPGMFSMPKP